MRGNFNKGDIAIIGMSGIFPKARNLEEYWTNLEQGLDCISKIPQERWDVGKYYSDNKQESNKTYSCWGGIIENSYEFDPMFFNIAPKEAPFIDPQQRKALEVAYETIENAGYSPTGLENTDTGVYLGVMGRGYFDKVLTSKTNLEGHMFTSSLLGFIPNRISFHLNLKGPSIAIDTLCSSSLVAIHEACKSILNDECSMALAGGVYIHFSAQHYVLLSKMNVLSKDGRCKTFDENANGIVSGEGIGMLLLKPVEKAIEDKDNIHAVIKGAVINNDGRSSRFTTTNAEAQVDMISKIFEKTNINPESISYIETHGTGTTIGDPTEIMALKKSYTKYTDKKGFCAIGSVKSNIGHLEPAAGAAGLIKTVMALKNGKIPPTLHINKVNHFIDIVDSPFIINDTLTQWNVKGVKRAGVSAFGMGGTNAHIILEEAPNVEKVTSEGNPNIFCFSAKTQKALKMLSERFITYLSEKEAVFNEVCFTSNISKTAFRYRAAFVVDSSVQLHDKLKEASESFTEGLITNSSADYFINNSRVDKKKVVFDLSGQIREKYIDDSVKNIHIIKEEVVSCLSIIKDKSLQNISSEDSSSLEQLLCKYLYFRILMKLGVIPSTIIYCDQKDLYVAAVLLGISSFEETVESIIDKKEISFDKTVRASKEHLFDLCKADQGDEAKYKNDFIITVPSDELYKSSSCFYSSLAFLYVNGIDFNWTNLYMNENIYKTELPTYPFERNTYRLDSEEQQQEQIEEPTGVLSELKELYKSFDCGIYSINFNETDITFYTDHKVQENAVLPAAAYLDAVYRAGQKFYKNCVKEINDFVVYKPLIVKAKTQLHIRLDKSGNTTNFSIYSCVADCESHQWQEHAKGKIKTVTDKDSSNNALKALKLDTAGALNIDSFYNYFSYTGINYGTNFKLLNSVKRNDTAAWSQFNLNNLDKKVREAFGLHPSALDAAFQTAVSLIYDRVDNQGEPFLPFYIKNLTIFQNEINKSQYQVIVNGQLNDEGSLKSNISILSESGAELVQVNGFCLKRSTAQTVNKGSDSYPLELLENLEVPSWVNKDKDFVKEEKLEGRYLLFDAGDEFSTKLKELFAEKQIEFIRVLKGASFQKISEVEYTVRPGEQEDIRQLFTYTTRDFSKLNGILYLWPLEQRLKITSGNIDSILKEDIFTIFILLKNIASFSTGKIEKFVVVTEEAWKIDEQDAVRPECSLIWGLMRVVRKEFLSMNSMVVDINKNNIEASALNIYKELSCKALAPEVAYRNCQRFDFSLNKADKCEFNQSRKLKSEGTYLITGGAGGIGLSLAENIDSSLKANIVLLGRRNFSELSKEQQERIQGLRSQGNKIDYVVGDVRDYDSMRNAVNSIKQKYNTIDGIFHTAGEIRDSLLKNKSIEDFNAVLAAKVKGTVILQELFKEEKIDFIMLFSSISSMEGILGQCDYAAANAFMDGMAESLTYGTNCLSINWSYWNAGMGAGYENIALKRGYRVLKPKEAAGAALHLATLNIRRAVLADKVKDEAPIIDTQMSVQKAVDLERYLITKLSEVLELPLEYLDTITSFTDLGMDSLLAVKFIEIINTELEPELDATEIFDYQNVTKLAGYIAEKSSAQQVITAELKIKNTSELTYVPEDNTDQESISFKVYSFLKAKLSETLEIQEDFIDDYTSFMELGMDSILSAKFVEDIGSVLSIDIDPTTVFDYPNLEQLSKYIIEEFKDEVLKLDYFTGKTHQEALECSAQEVASALITGDNTSEVNEQDIAIIGMACRFPKARNIEEFWNNLANGISVSENYPEDRIDDSLEVYSSNDFKDRANRLYGSYLDEIDKFDSLFFEISPKEAELMDPQQRVLLEVVWKAFEHAALSKNTLSGSDTGVFVGACITEYMKYIKEYEALMGTGNELSILSNRISYIYNLKGPSLTVDTACSSSLVALDLACENILAGKCSMAVAAGINLILTPTFSIIFEKAGMLSKDGRCKTFDEGANGYLRGEGAGAVLLKPLKAALEDKDNILAVIKGTSINQDGHSNGLTAPNAQSQTEVIVSAWEKGNIDPRTISMVEAHGTGTALGDPIEVKALTKAFRNFTKDNSFCAIGSVKTNIGHLEPAAGISGIIKTVLALNKKQIPPICNFNKLNSLINLVESPFYISDKLIPWKKEGEISRRAVVSSFGFGGTNAHVVLEEAPDKIKDTENGRIAHVIPFSAKNTDALTTSLQALKKYLSVNTSISLKDLSYTLFAGRDHYPYRISYIVEDINSLIEKIDATINNSLYINSIKPVSKDYNRRNIKSGFDLSRLASLYEGGSNIDWKEYFKNQCAYKIPLPEYPLVRKSYWATTKAVQEKRYTFIKKYLKEKPLIPVENEENAIYILVDENNDVIERLRTEFEALRITFVSVGLHNIGSVLSKSNADSFASIKIICSSIYDNHGNSEDYTYKSVLTLFKITRYLYDNNINKNIELINVSRHQEGSRSADIAAGAAASAFCRIIPYEFPAYKSKSIILGRNYNTVDLIKEVIEADQTECVYLKDDRRFVEEYRKINLSDEGETVIGESSPTVIVTGGLSGAGFEICKQLINNKKARLVITGRTELEARKADNISEKLANLNELRVLSPDVSYIKADVSNFSEMKRVFEYTSLKYGEINGVIHCAGIIDSEHISIRSKSEESIKKVLLPKINGTQNIGNLAVGYKVKKIILFSSLAALAGFTGVGFSDYAAANGFLDAYSEYMSEKSDCKVISVNWPVWAETGMSNRGLTTKEGYSIKAENAVRAFEELFESGFKGNIAIAGTESDKLINQLNNKKAIKPVEEKKQVKARVKSPTSDVDAAPKKLIKELLMDLLKLSEEDIDYDVDFSEYGIDSISLADMLGGIEKYYGKHFEPSIIIEYPNINQLGKYLGENFSVEEEKLQVDKFDLSTLVRTEVLKMLYEGKLTVDEVLEYMMDKETAGNY